MRFLNFHLSRKHIPKDSVPTLINALKLLEGIGEAIPVGGGVVKAIAKIGITLLEVSEVCCQIARIQ